VNDCLVCWLQEEDVEEEEEEETEEEAVDRMRSEISENYENELNLVTGAVVGTDFCRSFMVFLQCGFPVWADFLS